MNIKEIYSAYSAGSNGFCAAVEDNCGYDISRSEIARIAEKAKTAQEFENIWENCNWWTDKNSQIETVKYRFDSGLGQIHEYNKSQGAYLFLGTYAQYGITARMSENTKIAKIELYKERESFLDEV